MEFGKTINAFFLVWPKKARQNESRDNEVEEGTWTGETADESIVNGRYGGCGRGYYRAMR
jgi:hypothetical protein